jgi:glycerophosphoryl diester phosphodiesterase
VTDRRGTIAELPWTEVRRARVGGTEPIPLLEDLLGTWPSLRVNIDPKHDAVVEPLATVLTRTGAVDRVCVGSFSDRRLDRLRSMLGPRLCTSLGPAAVARLRASSYGLGHRRPDGCCVQVPVQAKGLTLVDERFVGMAHQLDLAVHVWTIDEPDEMLRLLDLGVDGIMTDRPAVLRDVLDRRGEWFPWEP